MTAILEIAGAVVLLLVSAWLMFDADDEFDQPPSQTSHEDPGSTTQPGWRRHEAA